LEEQHPELYADAVREGRIDEGRLLTLSREDQVALGEVLFQYHCNDCHAVGQGYSAVGPLLRGRSPEMIRSLILELDKSHFFMPPWAGTAEEAELLTAYLEEIVPPRPEGMIPGLTIGEAK
jgi:mono/diheme cytochrome c family protein